MGETDNISQEVEVEVDSMSDDNNRISRNADRYCACYGRKILVKEVFYVQSVLILFVVIASIVNIARDQSECDIQVWLLLLSSGVAQILPAPTVGKMDTTLSHNASDNPSDSKKMNYITRWHKRTSKHREIFYVQAGIVFIVVIACIIFLSLDVGDKNILIVLLSATYSQFLPGPEFIQKKILFTD